MKEVTIYDDGDDICENFGNCDVVDKKTCEICFIRENCLEETTLREALRKYDNE